MEDKPIVYEEELAFLSEKHVEGKCCCDPKYRFNVYDWNGKVHCVHCRMPLLYSK
jgi:hypothetical protein